MKHMNFMAQERRSGLTPLKSPVDLPRHEFFRLHVAAILSVICLLLPCHGGASPFVEVTTEISFDNWDYWFLSDKANVKAGENRRESLLLRTVTRHCVVGADTWKIDGADDAITRWFTGTNIIEYSVNTNDTLGSGRRTDRPAFRLMVPGRRIQHYRNSLADSVDGRADSSPLASDGTSAIPFGAHFRA